jgi:PleD family two-component response regulator
MFVERDAAALVTASTAAAAAAALTANAVISAILTAQHSDIGMHATHCNILLQVAEDNRINQRVLKKMLQDNCAELTVVSDGQQAVDAFHKVHIHATAL